MEQIKIKTEYIKLDDFLKFTGVAQTGGHAKLLIKNGEVFVDGEVCLMRGKKCRVGNIIKFEDKEFVII